MNNTLTISGEEIARRAMRTPIQHKVDVIRDVMLQQPQVECPLKHCFTPGLYFRELYMPKGIKAVTKIHKTEHPFVFTKGSLDVWTEEEGWVRINAPYVGITKPGTRRLMVIYEDTIMMTFHPSNETDIEKLEDYLFLDNRKPIEVDCL